MKGKLSGCNRALLKLSLFRNSLIQKEMEKNNFCFQHNFNKPTMPINEAKFYELVKDPKWSEAINMYRTTGDASYKRKLPAFIFQATFDETVSKTGKSGTWRKQAATRLTGLVVMDIDHIDNPKAVFESWTINERILLVYITPSGKGLKVVFKADPEEGNLIDNQHAMAKRLGVVVDEACKDASRMSFICKEDDILYISKELFTYENSEFGKRYDDDYRNGRSQGKANQTVKAIASPSHQESGFSDQSLSFKGVPYSYIISEYWKRNGGEPQEGERNVKLYQLAVQLRAICDNNPAQLLKVMPRLGLSEAEMTTIADSACKETPKGISKVMKEILDSANKEEKPAVPSINQQLEQWGTEIESMFDSFPVLRDACKGLKKSQYPAALFVAGGTMMTLMTRTWYRFYHRPENKRRLNCSLYIIGHPASNKSMADDISNILIAPIEAADKAGLVALNRYKQDTKKKAANKEGKDKPQGIIRIHPARTSNGQLIQDMINAKEIVDGEEMQLHMFTFDTELDNSITLQQGGSWINKQAMELKAFHNEKDGQMYQNADSPVDVFNVTWNYIYTGTPIALKKKVNEKNFGSGLSTRLAVIPMPTTNFEMLPYEDEANVDWERIARMKEWAYKLDKRAGQLPFTPLVKQIYDWTKDRMEECAEDNSEANELMLKRVAYHALNYAAPFIDMRHWDNMHQEGNYWKGTYEVDEIDWKLCELIARIQYTTQQYQFGAMAEKYFDDMNKDVQITGKRHYQKSAIGFAQLPEVFTADDVARCFGLSKEESIKKKIYRLTKDNQIELITEGGQKDMYRKLSNYLYS